MSWIAVSVNWSLDLFHTHTPSVILFGYILPFVVNAFEFSLRTVKEYHADLTRRAKSAKEYEAYIQAVGTNDRLVPRVSTYEPTLTIGHILARILGVITPFINFIVMICNMDRVFEWIGNIFKWMGKVFSLPLVPKR